MILSDVRLPDASGIDLVKKFREIQPDVPVIIMTAYGNIADGVQAIKNGAFDYIVKGDDNDKILPLIRQAAEKNAKTPKPAPKEIQKGFEVVLGESPAIQYARKMAKKVAATDASVLLTGETGTGKEVFAEAIHAAGNRKDKAFVALNCSAFGKDLLESELFGHRKGAFTGAVSDQKGLVEEADGGTLFLDEIGEMPLELQAKLLRLLESGEFIKMGETKRSKSNFRLIAATNRDLKEESAKGSFREDLYFRLNVFELHLPPLRERREDIPQLAKHFITHYAEKMGLENITAEAGYYEQQSQAEWKGNIRELKNAVERSIILMEGNTLTAGDLHIENSEEAEDTFSMSGIEKRHITKVLAYTGGNKAVAARLLDIGIATLYRKIEAYSIK